MMGLMVPELRYLCRVFKYQDLYLSFADLADEIPVIGTSLVIEELPGLH